MSKKEPTAAPDAKSVRLISIDLPLIVSEDCASVAASSGLPESKVRELVRGVATEAATDRVRDVRSIVKAHLIAALG